MDLQIRLHKDRAELVGPGDQVIMSKDKKMSDVLDSGFLSVEVRYHNPLNKVMVIERPPAVNAISGGHRDNIWDVAVPWQVYVVDYAGGTVRTYFRKEPLKSLDDEVFLCYLDHTKPDGSSCTDRLHYNNVPDLLEQAKEDPVKACVDLINDSVWGGRVRGASYMKWYADIPPEIKAEDRPYDNVSRTMDAKFDIARVMDEVTLLSYGDEIKPSRGSHGGWDEWFGKPLSVKDVVDKVVSKRATSAKAYFEQHV